MVDLRDCDTKCPYCGHYLHWGQQLDMNGEVHNICLCKIGNVEQGKYDKEYYCDNEFCPSYDETDSSTYNILIRTTEELHKANAELDYIEEQIEKNGAFDNTRKALGIATKCINWVIDTFQKGLEHESDVVGCCELSLERIEDLEQKDVK